MIQDLIVQEAGAWTTLLIYAVALKMSIDIDVIFESAVFAAARIMN
jgi:hypothetical protein